MSTEWPKAYNPKEVEEKIYRIWLDSGFFTPENLPNKRNKKFITCIAPPNITGELHMGHALELTLQDIIVRLKRMQGCKTLWLPGTDHAGIGAQNAVEKQLAKEGLDRHKLGREKFLERMWQWREQYGHAILKQLKKLGLSLDWSRTKFTMNPSYQEAVKKAFLHYYKKGWIYKGERVINWCVRCATAISDLEVNYVPEKGKLYFIKYGPFTLATARPETKLGDTGLAVHPEDKRYQKYIGQILEIESVDNDIPAVQPAKMKKIKIKVVADEAVDQDFGTGIVKVTPAHDLTDFEIGQKHNLPLVKVIDEHGRMNENAGSRYRGLKTAEAREKIVHDLTAVGLMSKIEDYDHNVGRCDRCDSVIEPLPSRQWFLKTKELAKMSLSALEKNKVKIHPERWTKSCKHWLENVRDWSISRQLWWGHQLPVWQCLCQTGKNSKFEIRNSKLTHQKLEENFIVSPDKPKDKCSRCHMEYKQVSDVLDTWFSSALWPLATLGWPNKNSKDFKKYYPTDFITSDRGILFLWQMRMVFSGMEFTKKPPFKDILIHATVLTKDGKRMSKSLDTGINPLNLIEKYGTDALRFGLASQATGLQDLRFGEDLLVMGKKFANKIWNIARYITAKTGENYVWKIKKSPKEINNQWTAKMDAAISYTTKRIEEYNFAEAANGLYKFIWHEVADKYLEETKNKNNLETKDTLVYLLINSLKLLHPFMPFITEEIYSRLPLAGKNLLLVENWP